MSNNKIDTIDKDLSFEQALEKLETIVAKLESGQANLEDALKQYEYGCQIRQFCEQKLRDAKLIIEKIDTTNPKNSNSA